MDPALVLPPEIFDDILALLEANDLARVTQVSRLWNQAGRNGVLWQVQCWTRWQGKRYMRRVYKMGSKCHRFYFNAGTRLWSESPEKWKWTYEQAEIESQRI